MILLNLTKPRSQSSRCMRKRACKLLDIRNHKVHQMMLFQRLCACMNVYCEQFAAGHLNHPVEQQNHHQFFHLKYRMSRTNRNIHEKNSFPSMPAKLTKEIVSPTKLWNWVISFKILLKKLITKFLPFK